jgi:prepilin-type processing-associated H-X9-DG protein
LYNRGITKGGEMMANIKGIEEIYEDAKYLVIEQQTASVSMLQRRFRIGYNKASQLIDRLEADGVIGPYEGSEPRKVLQQEQDKPTPLSLVETEEAIEEVAEEVEEAPKAPEKAGRKQLYDEMEIDDKLDAIRGWAMAGSTDKEIYTMLEVSKETFYKWKRERPQFADALKKGKHIANGELQNSAYKQAMGYYQTVTEPVKVKRGQDWEEIEMVTYEKFIPANNTMNIFMLKNRMPEVYKDKQHTEHSGGVNISFVDNIPEEDEEDNEEE